jgi:hypothetical protein
MFDGHSWKLPHSKVTRSPTFRHKGQELIQCKNHFGGEVYDEHLSAGKPFS